LILGDGDLAFGEPMTPLTHRNFAIIAHIGWGKSRRLLG
jgi:hypothetical protein